MAYITRELERKFLKLNAFFKVILVTGARPVSYTHLDVYKRQVIHIDRDEENGFAIGF